VNNGISLNNDLSNNLDYAYTNANSTSTNYTDPYIYAIRQTTTLVQNKTVPELTLTLWSGNCFAYIIYIKKKESIILLYRCCYAM
jgi:hypothetical protein